MGWFATLWLAIVMFFFPSATAEGEGCEHYVHLFQAYDLPVEHGMYICWRESRGFPDAVNNADPNGGSFGLMQINAIHIRDVDARPHLWPNVAGCFVEDTDDLLIGWKNICFASQLYAHAGWEPWGG